MTNHVSDPSSETALRLECVRVAAQIEISKRDFTHMTVHEVQRIAGELYFWITQPPTRAP